MKWINLSQPLGGLCPTGHSVKKEMPIPLAVPLALGAASALSSLWGASKASDAAAAQQAALAEEKRKLEAERLRKMNEDYIDTSAGQNMIRQAKEAADANWRKAAGAAAVGGSTDAAAQMAKDAGVKMIGDTIGNIAAQDTARKDNIDASYRSSISQLTQQQIAAQGAKAQATAQAAGAMSSALGSAAMATFGGTKLGQSWFGAPQAGAGGAGAGAGATGASAAGTLAGTTSGSKLFLPYDYDWRSTIQWWKQNTGRK